MLTIPLKSEWYKASGDPFAPHTDLFTDLNPTRHASNRRLVANLYSATSLRNMEGDVDECIDMLVMRLDQLAKSRQAFDLQFWMQSYAFDVIGQITVSVWKYQHLIAFC
jgi:cytochrome P450